MKVYNLYHSQEFDERVKQYEKGVWCLHISSSPAIEEYGMTDYSNNFFEYRLMHYSSKECDSLTHNDEVECLYMFGETVLITIHKYGQCPYKLKG
jgi:hypothetical protein